jgi:3-O-methylgallate 3,4-dioxygenase
VQSWKSDKRVAIIATGGLTHHIVDEGLDRAILSAMERKAPEDGITSFPEELFVDGTSEIKVWVVLAGVMAEGDLQMKLVNYSPCYRSPAGTGCGNAFAYWE